MAYADPYYNTQQYSATTPYVGPYYSGQQHLQYRAPYNQPIPQNNYAYGAKVAPTSALDPQKTAAAQRQATMRNFLTGDSIDTQPNLSQTNHERSLSEAGLDKPRKWTRGGGISCIGRFLAFAVLVFLYLAICALLLLGLFIRPPSLSTGQMGLDPRLSNPVQPTTDGGATVNLAMNISVVNPNYFSVNFARIEADVIYPVNSTQIGQGIVNNIVFESHSSKDFTFPLALTYSPSIDPRGQVLVDLLQKCGALTGQRGDISVTAKLTLGLRILFITISPSFSKDFSFQCPDQIVEILGGK